MGVFNPLILLGRPASGKSEFIDCMKGMPLQNRVERFHIGDVSELDDFVWLWEKFVEDDCWERAGYPRRYSTSAGHAYCLTNNALLDFCMARFNAEFPRQPTSGTVFIEFSRGKGDGGYRSALHRLDDSVLANAAVCYIDTSFEEACRRNEARYQERLKHSILAHKVPEADMLRFGKEIDWAELTQGAASGYLRVRDRQVPFVTVRNEPEIKEQGPLAARYEPALGQLWRLFQSRPGR
ncbi:MAG: hypothetical protein HYV03_07255 [Deltaproteobacteria bacterium]|nr:hypothetical protein [Deltaproteobacteria bacterium]